MRNILFTILAAVMFIGSANSQWTEQTSGVTTSLRSVFAVDDNVAWACGNAGRVVRTTNSGTTWTPVTNPAAADLYNITAADGNLALTTSSPGGTTGTNVYRTTNGGTTWTLVFNQPTAAAFIDAIWMTSTTNGFMMGDPVGGRWSLWRTTNGGANWDSTGLYLAQNAGEAGWNNGMMVLGTNIWFTTNATRIYYSSNNGTNWAAQTVASTASFGQVWFNTPLIGMSSQVGALSTTANSGTLWTPLATAPPGTGTVYGITGTGTIWFVVRATATGPIYKSTNNGVSWVSDYPIPTGVVNHMMKAINGNRLWAVQSDGGVSMSGQLIGITPISGEVPSSFSLSQNYPNPFNPTTNFTFAIPKYSNVSLKVYSTLGKEVATVYSGQLAAGKYNIDFNAENLSTGVYFYTLNTGDFVQTKKMMLVK